MRLLETVTIKRPNDCDSCPFGADDPDNGALCCGNLRDDYSYQDHKGRTMYQRVESPEDALKHNCDCMFVGIEEVQG